jgi:hypothetical protein
MSHLFQNLTLYIHFFYTHGQINTKRIIYNYWKTFDKLTSSFQSVNNNRNKERFESKIDDATETRNVNGISC